MVDSSKRFGVGGGSPWSAQDAVRALMEKFYELSQRMSSFGTNFLHLENVLGHLQGTATRLNVAMAAMVAVAGRFPGARLLGSSAHHAVVHGLGGGHGIASSSGGGGVSLGGGGGGKSDYNPNWVEDTLAGHEKIHQKKLQHIREEHAEWEKGLAKSASDGTVKGIMALAGGDKKKAIAHLELKAAGFESEANLHGNSTAGNKARAQAQAIRQHIADMQEQAAINPWTTATHLPIPDSLAGTGPGSKNIGILRGLANKSGDTFSYKGFDLAGKAITGTVSAGSEAEAIQKAMDKGHYTSSAERVKSGIDTGTRKGYGGKEKSSGGGFSVGGLRALVGGVAAPLLGAGAIAHGLMSAASPDMASTLSMSFQLLAGTIGGHLIPAFAKLALIVQETAGFLEKNPELTGKVAKMAFHSTGGGMLLGGIEKGSEIVEKVSGWFGHKEEVKKGGDLSGLLLSIRSMRAQPRYSSIEEAYKNTQLSAINQDPLEAKLQRMVTQHLLELIKVSAQGTEAQEEAAEYIKKAGMD